ncbi:MAG: hypothetical protein FJ246_12245, partial [Nitrospira sp.]|nr:hypothetical protein [Nitrospira sp.]
MSSIIHNSGAFIQQCFASHRLCLSLAKLALPDKMLLTCTACQMKHRLTLRSLTVRLPAPLRAVSSTREPEELPVERGAAEHLAACAATHQVSLGVGEMDVVQDFIKLRCAECRKSYDVIVEAF